VHAVHVLLLPQTGVVPVQAAELLAVHCTHWCCGVHTEGPPLGQSPFATHATQLLFRHTPEVHVLGPLPTHSTQVLVAGLQTSPPDVQAAA
jgi:hypothetical protein